MNPILEDSLLHELERLRTENAALKESDRLLRLSQQVGAVGSWDWEFKSGRVRWSDEMFRIFGIQKEDFAGTLEAVAQAFHPDSRALVEQSIRNSLEGSGTKVGGEYKVLRPDGSVRVVWGEGRTIRDEQDNRIGMIGTILDVTERKHAEETAERQRLELNKADKLVALGMLVSGVAHEISNPNNFIMLNLGPLLQYWRDAEPILNQHWQQHPDFCLGNIPYAEVRDDIPRLIEDIRKGAERIRFIIAELGDFAREEPTGEPGLCDLAVPVQNALKMLSCQIDEATDEFKVDLAPELPTVLADTRRLEQVVINLVLNACESLQKRSHVVRVSTKLEPGGDHVLLTVEDEGRGIPEKDLPYILNPFFTTKREAGGTGLGLAMVNRIVTEYGGELSHESEVGRGTTAQVRLPVADEADGPNEPESNQP